VRWIQIPVDPQLVLAMACGVSYGMVLTDDKGQVAEAAMLDKNPKPYTYDPSFEIQIYSRHAKGGRLAPKLEVTGAPVTTTGAGAIKDLKVNGRELRHRRGDHGIHRARRRRRRRACVRGTMPSTSAKARRRCAFPRYALPLPAAAGDSS